MLISTLRKKQQLSQEQLAEATRLSLRTIQRVEAGHRVGYASMRALAAHFHMDVDVLEQELYAMDKLVDGHNSFPRSVRHCFGKGGWHGSSRHELIRVERFCLFFFALGMLIWLSSFVWDLGPGPFPSVTTDLGNFCAAGGVLTLIGAYRCALCIRVGDDYDVWSKLAASHPGGIFGLFGRKSD